MSAHHFEVSGLGGSSLRQRAEDFQRLVLELANHVSAISLETHLLNADTLTRIAQVIPSNRYTTYAWDGRASPTKFNRAPYERLFQTRINFENSAIVVTRKPNTVPYDWSGPPDDSVSFVFEERHRCPVQVEFRGASKDTIEKLSEIRSRVLGQSGDAPVQTSTIYREDFRTHWYSIPTTRDFVLPLVQAACEFFILKNGLATYEFMGTVQDLLEIRQNENLRFSEFPKECPSLNSPSGAPFALGRRSFLHPEFNLKLEDYDRVVAILEDSLDSVSDCSIVSKYNSWKLEGNCNSPRVAGNYALLSRKGDDWRINLGYERFSDDDPPVRQFTEYAKRALNQRGASLLQVSNLR